MVAGHVGIQLLLSNFFYKFGEGRDNRDGAIVRWIGRIASFVDGVDDGVFPGRGEVTGSETGVNEEKQEVTNGVEAKPKDPDANTVGAGGSGVFHGKKNTPKRVEGDRL